MGLDPRNIYRSKETKEIRERERSLEERERRLEEEFLKKVGEINESIHTAIDGLIGATTEAVIALNNSKIDKLEIAKEKLTGMIKKEEEEIAKEKEEIEGLRRSLAEKKGKKINSSESGQQMNNLGESGGENRKRERRIGRIGSGAYKTAKFIGKWGTSPVWGIPYLAYKGIQKSGAVDVAKFIGKWGTSPVWVPPYLAYKGIEKVGKAIPPVRWASNAIIWAERLGVDVLKSPLYALGKVSGLRFLNNKIRDNIKVPYMKSGEMWSEKGIKKGTNRLTGTINTANNIAQIPTGILSKIPGLRWTGFVNKGLEKAKLPYSNPDEKTTFSDIVKPVDNVISGGVEKDINPVITGYPGFANKPNYDGKKDKVA